MNDQFERLLEEVNRIAAEDIPVVTENEFVKHILPFLLDETENRRRELDAWLNITGNPHRPIRVVGSKNEVLFTIPPILIQLPTDISEGSGERVHRAVEAYKLLLSNNDVVAADHELLTRLGREGMSRSEQDLLRYMLTWRDIQNRYNVTFPRLAPIMALLPATSDGSSPTATEDDGDREFEDL